MARFHLQASLTEENVGGLMPRLVLGCSEVTNLFTDGLQMTLCGRLGGWGG